MCVHTVNRLQLVVPWDCWVSGYTVEQVDDISRSLWEKLCIDQVVQVGNISLRLRTMERLCYKPFRLGWAVGKDAFKLIMNWFFLHPGQFPLFGVRYLRIGWNWTLRTYKAVYLHCQSWSRWATSRFLALLSFFSFLEYITCFRLLRNLCSRSQRKRDSTFPTR